MSLLKNRKKIVVVACLILFIGGYAWHFQQTIHRVQRSVEAENNMKQQEFYKNDLTYGDLSRTVKQMISEQDFDTWSTWKDVDKSFGGLPRPEANESDYVFQFPLAIGTAYVYYQFEWTGLKLSYVDVIPSKKPPHYCDGSCSCSVPNHVLIFLLNNHR